MESILDSVDRRTQMAGENRLELLLFTLDGPQTYGINVFKVKEIITHLPLTHIPQSNPIVRGVSHVRGSTVPIFDINYAIGGKLTPDPDKKSVILAEYNQAVQGFLVHSVIRIVDSNWEEILPPPDGIGQDTYMTAVTKIDDKLVEIIDVEQILADVSPRSEAMTIEDKDEIEAKTASLSKKILTCDDSAVARRQISGALAQVGIETIQLNDGLQALTYLKKMVEEGRNPAEELLMLISDVEMPEMDGYKLTTEIKADPNLKDLYVVLHTSLSGVFNNALVAKVGADKFIPKFNPNSLAEAVKGRVDILLNKDK